MSKAIDIANNLINLSIDEASKNQPGYFMDFYKVNKLLYIAQEQMLEKYDCPLFDDDIYALSCGPYIYACEKIYDQNKLNPIRIKIDNVSELIPEKKDVLLEVLKKYGHNTRQQLGDATRNTSPYTKGENRNDLKITFSSIHFDENDKKKLKKYEKNDN